MRESSAFTILKHPIVVALGIAALFSLRFLNCLPFSGFTRIFNQETITTLTSFLMFAQEPWAFPLGVIKGLAFPFADANIGNVGAIPLFALTFKALGKAFPYFQTFDYFVLVDIVSCFLTAYFSQKILLTLGVRQFSFRFLGALLTGASFLVFNRSAWTQPFCIVAFPLFTAWMYAMLLTLQRGKWRLGQDFAILCIYPIAALVDNYSLFAILLGTSVVLVRELYEANFGCLPASRNRSLRVLLLCVCGPILCVLVLYAIGMFPLPPVPRTFTSYDFGMGGRYHVADLFSPWLPVAKGIDTNFREPSLPGRLNFPLTTDLLAEGQYEGVAYIGTSALLLWILLGGIWSLSLRRSLAKGFQTDVSMQSRVVLYSPWKKMGWASLFVFIFSLGYELHILGHAFPDFSGMPAAWIADRFPSVYNIRAEGRLASLLSLFLILEAVRQLSAWYEKAAVREPSRESSRRFRHLAMGGIGLLVVIHLFEIVAFLRPVSAQPSHPIGGIYSDQEIKTLKRLGSTHEVVLISPSVRAVETKWTTEAFSLGYYLGLRSNLYYLARTEPDHDARIARDLDRVIRGEWDALIHEYGEGVLFAIPMSRAETLRSRMSGRYEETRVGAVSLWARRQDNN